jgi:hypothetical protein
MGQNRTARERMLLRLVLVVSLSGILYFGIRAVKDNSGKSTDNPYAYDISEYKASGEDLIRYVEAETILMEMERITALAVDGEGRIYVGGDGGVTVFGGDGERIAFFPMKEGTPRCLAVDAAGDLYAGLADHIEVFDSGGALKSRWQSPGERALITSIALAEDYVFAADAGTKVVWRFDRSGEDPKRIGDRDPGKDIPGFVIPSPYFDVAVDDEGYLWAANTGRHSMENYTPEGDLRSFWGESSMTIVGFSGCCNPSHFALMEDGSFVTSEKGLIRIKVTNRAGQVAAVVAGPDQFDEGTVGLDLAVDGKGRILVLDPVRRAVRIFIEKEAEGRQP